MVLIRERVNHEKRARQIYERAFGGPGGLPPISDNHHSRDKRPDKPPTWYTQLKEAKEKKQILIFTGLLTIGMIRALAIGSGTINPFPPEAHVIERRKHIAQSFDKFTYTHDKAVSTTGGVSLTAVALLNAFNLLFAHLH